ncbi:hypothetical protein FPSE_12398 [Fusarium pseudograminearum CS3096]|uniref:Uncharacterized protein n=1 Tax=Fusarium pseudograminearum (strain CS3096) TaxID=1028729 RepID=K3V6S6_FUSPC|nr:hypothetical protein FPSE_12398 [Fusarium pseudograminearum CS3096]EKJ67413.1 hypothetical protein FPSE_12398 [Fusarium pseudograminearum CS3096]
MSMGLYVYGSEQPFKDLKSSFVAYLKLLAGGTANYHYLYKVGSA